MEAVLAALGKIVEIIWLLVVAAGVVTVLYVMARAFGTPHQERKIWKQLGFERIAAPLDEAARAQSRLIALTGLKPPSAFKGLVDGAETHVFMLRYLIGGRRIWRDVAAFRLKAPLPAFFLHRKGSMPGTAAVAASSDDIDLAADPIFLQLYHVQSTDQSARALLTPAVTSFFRRLGAAHPALVSEYTNPSCGAESTDDWLLIWGPRLRRQAFAPNLDAMKRFLAQTKALADALCTGTVAGEGEAIVDERQRVLQTARHYKTTGAQKVLLLAVAAGFGLFLLIGIVFIGASLYMEWGKTASQPPLAPATAARPPAQRAPDARARPPATKAKQSWLIETDHGRFADQECTLDGTTATCEHLTYTGVRQIRKATTYTVKRRPTVPQ